jgi:hypothetical protein
MDAGTFRNRVVLTLLFCLSLFPCRATAQSGGLLPPGDLPEGPFTGFASSVSKKGEILVKLQPSAFRAAKDSLRKRLNMVTPGIISAARELRMR